MIVKVRKYERSVYAPVCVTLLIFILSTYFLFLRVSSQARQILKAPTSSANVGTRSTSIMSANESIMRNVSRPLLGTDGRRYIITTVGSSSYREYLTNMACSLGASKSRFEILLLALDSSLHRAAKQGLPSNVHTILFSNIRDGTGNKKRTGLTLFGTPEFAFLSRRKLAAARAILTAGYDVLLVDGDVVFCDPEAAISTIEALVSKPAYINSDIIAQRASVNGQVFNTGLYYARSNRRTISLLKAAENMESPGKLLDDQVAMNQMACDGQRGGEKIFDGCLWRDETNISLFPNDRTFPMGCTIMENGRQLRQLTHRRVREMCKSRQIALVHYSCWAGARKKRTMRKHGMWFVGEKTNSQCIAHDMYRT